MTKQNKAHFHDIGKGECPICGISTPHLHPEGWKSPKDFQIVHPEELPTKQPNIENLDKVLGEHFTFWDQDDETYVNGGWLTKASKDRIKATLQAHIERKQAEAEQNAVVWAVGVIDEMHIGEIYDGQLGEGTVGDKGYKAIKNTIRDRYKAETGIDPAPYYPVKAKLQATNPTKHTESQGGSDE